MQDVGRDAQVLPFGQMMPPGGDTIAAVATAQGRGGIAVIRVSGPEAFAIAERIAGRKATVGRVQNCKFRGRDSAVIDEGLMLAFKSPHSYTGEDVVEFQCHGGVVTPRRILESTFAAGARIAARGEFTERAFLNGKLPLEAAEGVLNLIDAKTDRAADAALAQMNGAESKRYRRIYEVALEISTDLEHALDVDEGELPAGYVETLKLKIEALRSEITGAIAKLHEGKILREGALVVLAGAPNAGKSSLLNALLGERRAIVSDTPGTTRDSIEEYVDIEGWPVRLVDTAGLRDTGDAIEREGVTRAEALIAKADVVLALDCEMDGALKLHAKCDLGCREKGVINVSAKTGEGLAELRSAIAVRLGEIAADADEPGGDRASSLLAAALGALPQVSDLVLMANSMRVVSGKLGELTGAVYSDDLLTSLFSRFCVGK